VVCGNIDRKKGASRVFGVVRREEERIEIGDQRYARDFGISRFPLAGRSIRIDGSSMSLVVVVTLMLVLAAFLIVGFLSVAHDLLSRISFESDSRSNELQIDRGPGGLKPSNQESVELKSDCLTTRRRKLAP
jgi:hypothetical protein